MLLMRTQAFLWQDNTLRRQVKIFTCPGIGRVHRYPLAELKCVSPKRRKEMAARLGGEPGGARGVDSQRYGRFRSLLRSGT